MAEEPGLRERKRLRTHAAISNAAIELFLKEGFDQVSITRIAAAAEVSRRTLFAYFPTKEDLVVHRIADHETESGRVVRERPAGCSPLTALREHFLDGLRRRDPITGLTDVPEIRAYTRLVMETPALSERMLRFRVTGELALADALRDTAGLPEQTARLVGTQIFAVQWRLALDNFERLADGTSAAEAYPQAVTDAERGFDLLANGIAGVLGGETRGVGGV